MDETAVKDRRKRRITMKKDVILKRVYCAVLAALSGYGLFHDLRDMVTGVALDTGMFLRLIVVIGGVYFFLHPEKMNLEKLDYGFRAYVGAMLNVGGGLFCVGYLFFGTQFGYPEHWKAICAVTAFLSVTGYLLLPFERKK